MNDKRQKVIAILWLLVALLQPITDICISEYGKLTTVLSVYNSILLNKRSEFIKEISLILF